MDAPTPISGGFHIKVRDDGKVCIDVLRMMYNWRIVLSDINHDTGYFAAYCYFGHGVTDDGTPRTMETAYTAAMLAATVWDGHGDPAGFDKKVFSMFTM